MKLNVLPTTDNLQTQFDYVREEVMKNYPLHVALSDFTKKPLLEKGYIRYIYKGFENST